MNKNLLAKAASAVLAVMTVLSFGGCSDNSDNMERYSTYEAFSTSDEIAAASETLAASCGFTDNMTEENAELIPSYFGFASTATSGSLYSGESTDQLFAVLKASDGMEVRLERTVISFMTRKIAACEDESTKAMLEKYVLKSSGGYVILVVSPDSEAAEAAVDGVMTALGAD
jgi:hypothetical protein